MTTQQQAEQLKGMYFLKNQYIPNGENIPFHILGYSFDDKFPISVKTIEYKGLDKKEVTNTYTIESINNIIANSISKSKPTNLNMLFQQMIINFAHLVDVKPLTKDEFLNKVKENYSLENAKTNLFYHSTIQSEFDTIRLSNDRNSLLFNQ
jgi:hypothetical protein